VLREAPPPAPRPARARLRPGVLALGIVTLVSLTAASCGHDDKGVSVGSATTGTVDEIVEAPGAVTARSAATLSAPAAGTLTDLRVEAGDQVRKGDVVAIIDSPELVARRDSAAKALDQASRGGSFARSRATIAARSSPFGPIGPAAAQTRSQRPPRPGRRHAVTADLHRVGARTATPRTPCGTTQN